jgi:hypothetical protein
MPELLQTINSVREREQNQRKFAASLKGISLDGEAEKTGPTFDDIKRRAIGINADKSDVLSLQGSFAAEAGFGIGMGLGYSKE